MGAGHSIAVQNFNENIGILVMVGIHAMMVKYFSQPITANASAAVVNQFQNSGIPPMYAIITGFGLMVALTMIAITVRFRRGVRAGIMND